MCLAVCLWRVVANKPQKTIRKLLLLRFLETAFIMANWIEWCPLIGLHLHIYIVFKALNLSGTDIMRLTFKLLNPEDVIRVLEREKGWGGGREKEEAEERHQREGLSDCELTETVQQDDSAGLLLERLPACQFRCNIFIDTLLAATWQAGRSSTFTFHTRSSGLVKQVALANFGGNLSFLFPCCCLPPLIKRKVCTNGNVYSLDLEKALGVTAQIFWIHKSLLIL